MLDWAKTFDVDATIVRTLSVGVVEDSGVKGSRTIRRIDISAADCSDRTTILADSRDRVASPFATPVETFPVELTDRNYLEPSVQDSPVVTHVHAVVEARTHAR